MGNVRNREGEALDVMTYIKLLTFTAECRRQVDRTVALARRRRRPDLEDLADKLRALLDDVDSRCVDVDFISAES